MKERKLEAGRTQYFHSFSEGIQPSCEVFACSDVMSSLISEKNRSNTMSCRLFNLYK
jgi:hypothetical protein